MTEFRLVGSRSSRRLAVLVVVPVLVVSFSAWGAETSKKGKAKGQQATASSKVLKASVDKNKPKANPKPKAPKIELPPRPPRTVSTPTLTPVILDAMISKFLADSKVMPAAITTDVEFVRRAFLDLTGKLPSPDQTRAFVVSRGGKEKRGKLIEYLLNTPEYADNMAHYWRDVIKFRATNENAGQVGYNQMEDWLADQFEKNTPWDEISRKMITATGRTDENGAVALTLAHDSQAVEMAGEVSRIFLGVQIQCAQCHDHPNDSWKRTQFHEFAAFFAGARGRRVDKDKNKNVFEVVLQGTPRYTMPDKADPTKLIPVDPKFFLASSDAKPLPPGLTAEQRHELVASYVVGQDNPWFAKAFVNRAWLLLMGEAFYSPVDDMGPERTAKAGEIIDALATQWQKGGYDVRWLFRTIMSTEAYQREIRSTVTAAGRTPFAANCPSRLRSDQILDSLAQALDLPDARGGGGPQGKNAASVKNLVADAAPKGKRKQNGGPRLQFNNLFGVDPSTPNDDVLGTIPQALFMMNGTQINNGVQANPRTVLGKILAATSDNRAALDAIYLRVLARAPTAAEFKTCSRYMDLVGNRNEAFEDIFWSLLNSTEFITRR
jgi:hypothetical protein